MKKINLIFIILFIIFTVYSILNITETKSSSMNAISIFSKTILPALLPFLILNQLIIKLGIIDLLSYFFQYISYPLFKISGKGASIIMIGLLNGFPSSAIFTSMLYKEKQINRQEAQRLINSIFFPSISFLFAIININLNNNILFTYLILSLYLAGFITLYLSSLKINEEIPLISFKETLQSIKEKATQLNIMKELKNTIAYSFNTLINILGVITLFSIPCNIIDSFINNNSTYFFKGLIEFSIPSINLASLNIKKEIITLFLGIILSFSGLSSILQATLFIEESSLNTKQFIISRICISILTTTILYLFLFFL